MIMYKKNLNEIKDEKEFKKFKLLFCSIWLIVGTVFLAVAYFSYNAYNHKKETCTLEQDAIVSNLNRKQTKDSDGEISVSYYPEFTYTIDGLTYIKEYSYGNSKSNYHIGEHILLLLDPNDYDTFLVDGDNSPMIFTAIFGGLGAILLLLGFILSFALKFKSQEQIDEETDEYIKENTISRDQFETVYKDDGDSPFVK